MLTPEVKERERTIKCKEVPGLESYGDRTVTIRKLTYGDKGDLQDTIVQIGLDKQNIKIGQLRIFALVFGIRDAPFFDGETGVNAIHWDRGITGPQIATRAYILRNLEEEAGLALMEQVYELNPGLLSGLGDKKKSSTGSLKDEQKTQAQAEQS